MKCTITIKRISSVIRRSKDPKPLMGLVQRVTDEVFFRLTPASQPFLTKEPTCFEMPLEIDGANPLNAVTTAAREPGNKSSFLGEGNPRGRSNQQKSHIDNRMAGITLMSNTR